jgi:UDP-glucose 4-epimerase
MQVVVVDTVGGPGTRELGRALTERLVGEAVFDKVVPIEWAGREDRPGSVSWLADQLRHIDAVVTLPWTAQDPLKQLDDRWVERTQGLCEAIVDSGVDTLVYGSSALGYSPTLTDGPVDERWPMTGRLDTTASRHLAAADEDVEDFERDHPVVRVVRLRPSLVIDPKVPADGRRVVQLVAHLARVRVAKSPAVVQLLHVEDLIEAFRLALLESVSGPFNLGTQPVPMSRLADARFAVRPARGAPFGSPFPVSRPWLRLASASPVVDSLRAERELGWSPASPPDRIIGQWAARRANRGPRASTQDAGTVSRVAAPTQYEAGLHYFGQCVEAIRGEEWEKDAWPSATVAQIVAAAARDQYRVVLILEGVDEQEAERQLPADPLGDERSHGWKLAARRGQQAVREEAGDPSTRELWPERDAETLATAATDLVVRGWCVSRTIADPPPLDAGLLGLVRTQAAESGVDGAPIERLAADELFTMVCRRRPPIRRDEAPPLSRAV